MERLIERTILPLPLPGLTLRVLSPERGPGVKKEEAPSRGTLGSGEAPSREWPPSSPALSADALADKVLQKLQRQNRLELERRGLY